MRLAFITLFVLMMDGCGNQKTGNSATRSKEDPEIGVTVESANPDDIEFSKAPDVPNKITGAYLYGDEDVEAVSNSVSIDPRGQGVTLKFEAESENCTDENIKQRLRSFAHYQSTGGDGRLRYIYTSSRRLQFYCTSDSQGQYFYVIENPFGVIGDFGVGLLSRNSSIESVSCVDPNNGDGTTSIDGIEVCSLD